MKYNRSAQQNGRFSHSAKPNFGSAAFGSPYFSGDLISLNLVKIPRSLYPTFSVISTGGEGNLHRARGRLGLLNVHILLWCPGAGNHLHHDNFIDAALIGVFLLCPF